MRHHYNLIDANGFFIGNLHELELAVCPRAGDEIAFAADGQAGEVSYIIERVRHIIHLNLGGEQLQTIDLHVRPAVTLN